MPGAGRLRYEGRSWVGWHHHMTLCLLARFFLMRPKLRWQKAPRVIVRQVADLLRRPWPDSTWLLALVAYRAVCHEAAARSHRRRIRGDPS